ncbi:MAG: hypothetical protein AAF378_25745, partial [Cyanobacteria bacterium P01_A01_bin.84]
NRSVTIPQIYRSLDSVISLYFSGNTFANRIFKMANRFIFSTSREKSAHRYRKHFLNRYEIERSQLKQEIWH